MASIQKRHDGNYRARYRDEAGKEHARHFKRKVEAQRWLDEVTTAVVTGAYVDPKAGKVTFARFYDEWSERQIWVPSTRVNAERVRSTVPFGDLPMKAIRRSHIESWVKAMTAGGLAASTIKTRFIVLRSLFRAAVADRVIVADPSLGVTLPRRRSRAASMAIPSEQQVGAILRAARPEFKAFIALCAFAGLRSGEAAGIQVGDIGLRELRIARQVQRDSREVAVRAPKYGSERTIFAPQELVTILSQHIETFLPDAVPSSFLFRASDGEPLDRNAVHFRWRRATSAARVVGVRLHDLRHFFASGLIAQGCDVVTVQRALGHASATTTLATYSHLWPNAEDRTRNASASLIRSSLANPADSLRTETVSVQVRGGVQL
ncbi:tyrosine-type recombinase/integrase [Nocardioides pocheonensis]|uniref:Site-specific integrase n=1 Tax=Nocardioides pocheonensis TaxID=661485 RepID=A0A3N0GS75_9ACTN|nr:site-specific integrase [Nocardioides pocheonensis]RNM15315.1 site-specific integrase [Nocardioides pocheonensis]